MLMTLIIQSAVIIFGPIIMVIFSHGWLGNGTVSGIFTIAAIVWMPSLLAAIIFALCFPEMARYHRVGGME
jgi:hypothetical protein